MKTPTSRSWLFASNAHRTVRTVKAHFNHRLVLALLLLGGTLLLPGAVFAAEEGSKWGFWFDAGRLFNLAVVIAVLVWVARKPLANFYASRAQAIREQLVEAQAARQKAEARLAEMEARMSRLNEELKEIKDQSEREAQEEYQRLLSAAERDALKIIEHARQEIEGITRAAQNDLKAHVANLSVQLAEEKIREEITDEDRSRLISGFVTKVGGER